MKKDLISINDLTASEINSLFLLAGRLKKNRLKFHRALAGKTLALIFQKPSNRTRVSFEVGMFQLGGHSLYLSPGEINLGVRESIADVSRTISRYVDGVVLRTFEHKNCVEMAGSASIAVINGLSDYEHPCQALADLYTVKEKLKTLNGVTLSYVGDGNNVCNSLLFICAKLGVNMRIGSPQGYEPERKVFSFSKSQAERNNAYVKLFSNPFDAVKGADIIYTDVWASMGQEKETAKRKKAFGDFQINSKLVNSTGKRSTLVMHCLPAHRGEEITDEVLDSKNSVVFDQAENRMHVQKAVLIKLLG